MPGLSYLRYVVDVAHYDDARSGQKLRATLAKMYGVSEDACFLTTTGRIAEYLFLRSLGLDRGISEVIVQAFTCVSVVDPVLWCGLRPVFADIDPDTLSISVESLDRHMTAATRAIVVQHSFGIPGPIAEVVTRARVRGIYTLEDCAHALGATTADGSPLGTQGDAALLSFGVEKTLWTKYGGALIVNNSELIPMVHEEYQRLRSLSHATTFGWLMYPLWQAALRRLPGTGRVARNLLVQLRLLQEEVSAAELRGGTPRAAPAPLPGVFSALVSRAIERLDVNLAHRATICTVYREALHRDSRMWTPSSANPSLIKFPVICDTPELRAAADATLRRRGITFSRWFDPVVFPRGVDAAAIGYHPLSCSVAEDIARRVINLPTGHHMTSAAARSVVDELLAEASGVQTRT